MGELIKCAGCGQMREWVGMVCVTACPCTDSGAPDSPLEEYRDRISELEKENAELKASISRIVDKAIDQHVAELASSELPKQKQEK